MCKLEVVNPNSQNVSLSSGQGFSIKNAKYAFAKLLRYELYTRKIRCASSGWYPVLSTMTTTLYTYYNNYDILLSTIFHSTAATTIRTNNSHTVQRRTFFFFFLNDIDGDIYYIKTRVI